MDSIQFSEFSTTGVNNSDTFDVWRKKTNGIVSELGDIRDAISPLFYEAGQASSTLLRTVTLDTNQTVTGAKTFSGGTASSPTLKIGAAGLYEDAGDLTSTVPLKSDRIVVSSQLQLGAHPYVVPTNNPTESSLLGKSGNALTWTSLNSIISQIQTEGAANVVTTNIVLPVGTFLDYASSGNAPSGWLRCNGVRFKGSDYPELATLLLNRYAPIYTTQTGSTVAGTVSYNPNWWYTLPTVNDSIIKATPDSVVNTFIDRGNAFDIIKDGTQLQSLPIANGGTGVLNIRHDNTLSINSDRRLGVSPGGIGPTQLGVGAVDPSKLSLGGPSWDAASEALYEGRDSNTRRRVATREYVDEKIFKSGPVAKLVSSVTASPHTSHPGHSSLCYINHDGVPIISGASSLSRFGTIDKYSHCEMPLPDNRKAVELHLSKNYMCALDDVGQLWMIGDNTTNMFNIVPSPGTTLATWNLAFTPLYSGGNIVKRVIISSDIDDKNIAVIDNLNQLWISGTNTNGVLGRGNVTSTGTNGESSPVLSDVFNAILLGNAGFGVCVALKSDGIYTVGYGGQGQRGDGTTVAINNTFKRITIADISDYSACDLYGCGSGANTSIYVKTPNNLIYAWGYNGDSRFGDGTTANKNIPTKVFENPDLNIDRLYTTTHTGATGAVYVYGQKNNATILRGSRLESTVASQALGTSLSCSDSGDIVAIGAPGGSGRVQCHVYNGLTWAEYGSAIAGNEASSRFGASVSINALGTRLAIGAPDGQRVGSNIFGQVRIYDYVSGTWTQFGSNLIGETTGSKYGESVALSGNGNAIIIGSPGHATNTGRVYVRRLLSGGGTEPIGDPITGTATFPACGRQVAINSDGTIIAIASNGVTTRGVVRLYRLFGNSWLQYGNDITGLVDTDNSTIISLSGDGARIAIGAPGRDTAGSNSGSTRVFEYSSSSQTWVTLGNSIDGQSVGEASGSAVSLSRNGTRLAIGAPNGDTLGRTDNGTIRLFEYVNGTWKLLTGIFSGEASSEKLGFAVALSADGTKVFGGSPTWNSSRGRVTSWGFVQTPSTQNEIWCAGINTGDKFGLIGASSTWRTVGTLPQGYSIENLWCGNNTDANTVNFIKAKRAIDGLSYLFVAGTNANYQAGIGHKIKLSAWTRLNLRSEIVERIVGVQSILTYTVFHLNDGTIYFAGANTYAYDPNLPTAQPRTDFTRIK